MSTELKWFKSTYSGTEGGACLEVAYDWRKSSYSDFQEATCVEVAACPHTIRVRDSKLGEVSPQLAVDATAWDAFVTYARGA